MDVQTEIEALTVIEKIKHEELPSLAAMVLVAWCRQAGVSPASVEEFVRRMSADGNADLMDVLADMLGAYRVGATRFGEHLDFEAD